VVTPFVTLTVTLSGAATAVVGSTVTVTATIAGAGSSYSINWYDNGVLFATTTVPMVTYTVTAGTDSITATVIPSAGCYDSATSAAHVIFAVNEGITDLTASHLRIYPNPAHNQITISGNNITCITIVNTIGQTLITTQPTTSLSTLSLTTLPPGIYLVTVTATSGQKSISKLIKQ